jgi:hypothetical protein
MVMDLFDFLHREITLVSTIFRESRRANNCCSLVGNSLHVFSHNHALGGLLDA